MLLTVFEKYIFLQSLGWGIASSLWQASLLWMLYKCVIAAGKNISSLFKHYFSIVLLFSSFIWFVATTLQNYIVVKETGKEIFPAGWVLVSESLTVSLQLLSILYFLLLGYHCLQLVKKLQGIITLKNTHLIKVPVSIRLFTEQTALHIGIRKKVSVWLSAKADVPSVIGFCKPVILLPVSALNNLTTQQAEAVILHELAHIKRNDYIINFIQCIVETLMFFNPFVRMLGNTARKERENCCDDWVLNFQYNKHDYASALLLLEQNRSASVQFALAATNGKKQLFGRIKRLFHAEPQVNFSRAQKIKLAAATVLVIATVLFVLPSMNSNPAKTHAAAPAVKMQDMVSVAVLARQENIPAPYNEIKPATITSEPLPEKKQPAEKPAEAIKQAEYHPEEYTTAFINEELLKEDRQLQEMAILAANKGLEIAQSIIVKIEEERSGEKDKNTYLVELKNNNGLPEVKPLIILNQKIKALGEKIKAESNVQKQLADSVKKVAARVRITS